MSLTLAEIGGIVLVSLLILSVLVSVKFGIPSAYHELYMPFHGYKKDKEE